MFVFKKCVMFWRDSFIVRYVELIYVLWERYGICVKCKESLLEMLLLIRGIDRSLGRYVREVFFWRID